MKDRLMKTRIVIIFLSVLLIIYFSINIYTFSVISKYDDKLYPNMHINNYDISNISKKDVKSKVNEVASNIENNNVFLIANDVKYEYKFSDLGISINKDDLLNEILTYDKDLNNIEKMRKIVKREKTMFKYDIGYSEQTLNKFVKDLKSKVDTKVVQEKLVMDSNRNLKYVKGTPSFSLDVARTVDVIKKAIPNLSKNNIIKLEGASASPKTTNISSINKKVSTFTTTFNDKVSRAKNLANAAKNLDGVIIQPGATFSYYKYAGPYNKKGYVYYDGVMGNGVCQVATTIYNTALLGGLKIVERYSHAYKMVYVDGGRDATVAANSRGSVVDFKFKNIYKYPIYISAYVNKDKVTIEFWSNENSTNGESYDVVSEKIAAKGYKTYKLVYKNGKQIKKEFIATTWYPK